MVLLRAPLPLDRIAFFISVTAFTNALLTASRPRRGSQALCGAILALDTCTFTGLLMATGGASNPFSVLYLVHINLAAVS